MKKVQIMTQYYVLGVMSGTSLDGIDLVAVNFEKTKQWKYQIQAAETIAYPQAWKIKLGEAQGLNSTELQQLNDTYTDYLAEVIHDFTQKHQLHNLDAVCSHGHTVLHQPDRGITFQIGNQAHLAKSLNCLVVCDFRVADVQLGGQGAPLVPIGDRYLFQAYDGCLNLGGFANISLTENGKTIAYDICAVNTVLNPLAEQLGFSFDRDGENARAGKFIPELFDALQKLEFYNLNPPKSLGIEWVQEKIQPLLVDFAANPIQDLLHTYTKHIAHQIARHGTSGKKILVTGGGAWNVFLMECIVEKSDAKFQIPEVELVEFKEALIFGLLGVLRLENEINCLSSVTGCKFDHSSGVLFSP